MPRGRFLIPDTIPTTFRCRVLFIPDDVEILAAVNGQISELLYPQNWEQTGAATPDDMASAMGTMFWDYAQSECAALVERYLFSQSLAPNTGGGSLAVGNNTVPYNQTEFNDSNLVTLASNIFTVKPGRWHITMWHMTVNGSNLRLEADWTGTNKPVNRFGSTVKNASGRYGVNMTIDADVTENDNTLKFIVNAQVAQATIGFGDPINQGGNNEYYGEVSFLRFGDV